MRQSTGNHRIPSRVSRAAYSQQDTLNLMKDPSKKIISTAARSVVNSASVSCFGSVVHSRYFDAAINFVIICNSIMLGYEQAVTTKGGERFLALKIMENIFLLIYVLELTCRFVADGFSCLRCNWVKFDVLFVLAGLLSNRTVKSLIGLNLGSDGFMIIFRMSRLLRLGKAIRLLVKFQTLWMLVRGLLDSAGTMFYTLGILSAMLYIFSCIGVELITNHPLAKGPDADPMFKHVVDKFFSSLPNVMLTLMQFVCMDSIGAIYRPLVEKEAYLIIYFVAVILIIPIVLMNLVTAVIVQSALEQANEDREAMQFLEEQKKAKQMKEMRVMFQRLDEDGSGHITLSEIESISAADKQVLRKLTDIENPVSIFHALDVKNQGQLSIDDFCQGLWEVAITKVPLEIKRIATQVDDMYLMLADVLKACCQVQRQQEYVQSIISQSMEPKTSTDDLRDASGRENDSFEAEGVHSSNPHSIPAWAEKIIAELQQITSALTSGDLTIARNCATTPQTEYCEAVEQCDICKERCANEELPPDALSGTLQTIPLLMSDTAVLDSPYQACAMTPMSKRVSPGRTLSSKNHSCSSPPNGLEPRLPTLSPGYGGTVGSTEVPSWVRQSL